MTPKKKKESKKETQVNKRQKTRKFFQINYQWLHALAAASPSPPIAGPLGRFLGNLSLPLMG